MSDTIGGHLLQISSLLKDLTQCSVTKRPGHHLQDHRSGRFLISFITDARVLLGMNKELIRCMETATEPGSGLALGRRTPEFPRIV